jgi:hypothetical protein
VVKDIAQNRMLLHSEIYAQVMRHTYIQVILTYMCTYKNSYTYIHTYIRINAYTYTYTYTCTYPHTHTHITRTQSQPLVHFTWDTDTVLNTGSVPDMNLTATGVTSTAPASTCGKDGPCIKLNLGEYFALPAYNFGQHSELTFSMWFRPDPAAAAWTRLFECGVHTTDKNIEISRKADTTQMRFMIRRPDGSAQYDTPTGAWQSNVWRHFIWSIARKPDSTTTATWKIYLDGLLVHVGDGVHPADDVVNDIYLGRAAESTASPYSEYMDSFRITPVAVTANEARLLFTVSLLRRSIVCLVLDCSFQFTI